ncbi:MAG: hypothetical protein NZ901_02575 [Geminocystis sp.]|nr:hypothetical protein [Geminocystis sp.]HIK37916.1 hypothetical protein [Geminocystis sp. M7585_C2015_104]MCS7147056.1 hypothetical protein [Geminocystis sp.]MCX8079296.1 hypothetical protein [Geminocystis sp.]MDW8115879.1 hypothetical protein [Geminocystis sp.]
MKQNNNSPISLFIKGYLPVSRERGFSSVLALALGTIIIGGAFLAIARASQSRTNAVAQQQTNQALAAAEAGVARVQNLLLQEPRLAILELSRWREVASATDASQRLTELTGINSSGSSSTCSTSSGSSSSSQDIKNRLTQIAGIITQGTSTDPTDWVQLGDNSSYRIIGYDGNGNLTVQGRLNNNNAIARIAVRFNVNQTTTTSSSSDAVPVVWLGSHEGNDIGNNDLMGKVRVTVPNSSTSVTSITLGVGRNGTISGGIETTTQCMPPTPPLPPSGSYYSLSSVAAGTTFPRSGDQPDSNGYYHYLVPSLTFNGNGNLTISAGRKVVFYLQGNLDIGGNFDIIAQNGARLEIYGNTNSRYGCPPGATGNCNTTEIKTSGGASIRGNVFIHAPEARAGINGGGNTNPNFQGAIWVKNWGFSNSNVGQLTANGTFNDYLGSRMALGNTRITIRPAHGWKREAVSQNP